MDRPLRAVVEELQKMLDSPKTSPLPWKYGDRHIEGRISDEWPIDNKTLARAAVNALPRLLEAVKPYLAEEDRKHREAEDQILREAEAIKRRRAVA